MQQLGTIDILQRTQRADKLHHIVAIDDAEVAEVEALEEIAVLQKTLLHTVASLTCKTQQRWHDTQHSPQRALEAVVEVRCRDAHKISVQSSRRLIDRHRVVVEYHQEITLGRCSSVVHTLEREAASHRTVANNGYDVLLAATHLHSLGHTEGCRDTHRRVSCAKRVVLTLGHTRKAADAIAHTVLAECLPATRNDLVGVGLMADIPDDVVRGHLVDIVQSYSEFHRSETRTEVARINRTALEHIAAQLAAIGSKLRYRQTAQRLGRVDGGEIFIFCFAHFSSVVTL